jgi:LacI family transcriptional regulator
MNPRKATLKDIASLSGVSIGTVDRVLHHRGEVAEKTRRKVLRIARQLNYTPNLMAQALKTKKRYNIISLLPVSTEENAFWSKHPEGMEKAMAELDQFPVGLTQITFDMNSEEDFQEKSSVALNLHPDGILLAPIFKSESISFCSALRHAEIPFVFVDNYLYETGFLAYVGEDVYRSGRVAGQLTDLVTPSGRKILIVSIAKNLQNMHHLNSRTKGFLRYFTDSGSNSGRKIKLNIPSTESEIVSESIEKVFARNPGISSVFVTGSKSYKIAEYLYMSGYRKINVIGYDLLENNVQCLKQGKIRFLIGQRPEEQTYRGVKKLFDYLSLNKTPEKIEYLPVDVVTSENVDFFINGHFNSKNTGITSYK